LPQVNPKAPACLRDRKMRGLRRFLYASAEDIPAAGGREKDKGGNSCGEPEPNGRLDASAFA
jgi:hypothetical protein